MPKGILSTDEEVNSATTSGMYHVFGRDGISVVSNYSIMIVFNDGQGYVIQMTFRLGEDVVGSAVIMMENGEILGLLYWLLRNMAPHMALCISGSGGTGLYRTTRFLIMSKIRFANPPNHY